MSSVEPTSQSPTLAVSNSTVESKKEVPAKESKTADVKSQATQTHQQKIERLFAQAGVSQPKSSDLKSDLSKKVSRRQYMVLQRKLLNLEKIMTLAMQYSLEASSNDAIDPDWFFSFVEMAEDIHSLPMQELWGKILAVEVAKAGSFSLRTLKTLKQLTQKDAQTFSKAVGMACRQKHRANPQILVGYYQKPRIWSFLTLQKHHQVNLAEYGLSYPEILSLIDMGLIYNSEIESGELRPGQKVEWRCGKEVFFLTAATTGIALNYYKFTSTGSELLSLVGVAANKHYLAGLKTLLGRSFNIS
ncbi:TIGR03899 family protein [Alteromonadaceae bacterium M269]|nr:TIGR03899 family protein [Alteromonadaceae bacterium M269]